MLSLFSVVFHSIFFILAGNEDMHERSDKFEVLPDPTTPVAEFDVLERLETTH